MDLEQRIQALEQEIQVLKNQIQATLLDIQEHVLTNTYPLLRAEDTPTSGTPRHAAPPPVRHSQVTPDEPRGETASNVRKISLSDLNGPDGLSAEDHDAPPAGMSRPRAPQPAHNPARTMNMRRAQEWATQKIQEVGLERTRFLVESYANDGRFAPEVVNMLEQYLTLHDPESDWSQPTRPRLAEPARVVPAQPAARPQPAPRSKSAPRPQPAPRQETPAPRPAPEQPAPQREQELAEETNHNLVLKLIAGVANAGMNNRRKKYG